MNIAELNQNEIIYVSGGNVDNGGIVRLYAGPVVRVKLRHFWPLCLLGCTVCGAFGLTAFVITHHILMYL